MNMSQEVLILTGPTASGKAGVIVKLAEKFPIGIVPADFMKIYRTRIINLCLEYCKGYAL
jgi:tRNA A37 N6-isopentenylltransferase MiaA